MGDAIYCNARLRALEITRLLPIINGAYDVKSQNERTNLISFTIAVSILMFFLFGAIIYIYIQLKAISKIRKSLKNMNQELLVMNEDLNSLHSVLSESNHVKEEYIGYVFSICSAYIDKMEDFRKNINRKLKTGKVEDVVMLTNPSSSLIQNELKEFYKNFDTIFLNLYPDFVDQFNTLYHLMKRYFRKKVSYCLQNLEYLLLSDWVFLIVLRLQTFFITLHRLFITTV